MGPDLNIKSEDVGLSGFRPLIDAVSSVCLAKGIEFFVIGATARDLLLEHVHKLGTRRATGDVDIAVAVAGWPTYDRLRHALISKWAFVDDDQPQRLLSRHGLPLDIIPFGDIEDHPGQLDWPPDQHVQLSTLGLEAASRSVVTLSIDQSICLPVASLPAVGLLKLMAWSERPAARGRDAEDLCHILSNYYDATGSDLYELHSDVFDEEPFDTFMAGCRIFGRDLAGLVRDFDEVRMRLLQILDSNLEDIDDCPLARAMAPGCVRSHEERIHALQWLRRGLVERIPE